MLHICYKTSKKDINPEEVFANGATIQLSWAERENQRITRNPLRWSAHQGSYKRFEAIL